MSPGRKHNARRYVVDCVGAWLPDRRRDRLTAGFASSIVIPFTGQLVAQLATLAGLLGLLSVTGRVVTTLSTRWLPMAPVAGVIFVGQGVAMSLLAAVGRQVPGAIACLVLFGLGFGVASIASPAIVLDRYGAAGYGTIAGTLAAPVLVARASAPLGGALVAAAAGYLPLVVLVASACVVAGLLHLLVARLPTARPASHP